MKDYIIQDGDNLGSIAQKFDMSVTNILAANLQITAPNSISSGLKIRVPDGTENSLAEVADTPDSAVYKCNRYNPGDPSNKVIYNRPVFLRFDGSYIYLYKLGVVSDSDFYNIAKEYKIFHDWFHTLDNSISHSRLSITLLLKEEAMAGVTNYNAREYEHLKDYGPPPYGSWRLNFKHWRASDPDPNDDVDEHNTRGKFTHHNMNLAERDRVAVKKWEVTADYGSGGWALTPVDLPTGLGGRSGFVFHEDANANGSIGCVVVGYRKIIPFYDIIYPTVQNGFDKVYMLIENYETGRQRPSWNAASVRSVDE